jgi:hypothetical protein
VPGLDSDLPRLLRDRAHPAHICAGFGLTLPTSAPGPGSPRPHLQTIMLNTDIVLAYSIGDADVNTQTCTVRPGGDGTRGTCAAQTAGTREFVDKCGARLGLPFVPGR